ncbi:MAG: DUF11 domain-containing protein [Acidimicrobiales bacterium]|nr:DUF11 domain-containing protein [Hyphomonadaceae bacterium]RZV42370.1 MAG: DUF11 domain-containing protein [Acidimicrobiales bacterium]
MANQEVLLWARRLAVAAGSIAAYGTVSAHAADLGQTVTNIAVVSYENADGGRLRVITNPAQFVVEAERTASTIEFFRYSPNGANADIVQINGADYSATGDTNGTFAAMPLPTLGQNTPLNLGDSIPLIPASMYNAGEIMFVRVTDPGQNGNPNEIETIVVTIETDAGDTITLRLYESGPDTGHFWAYVPSTRKITPINDTELTTEQGTQITATYIDSFDSTEISIDTALVDPHGRVFNGLTGELVNNARVTLIDYTTGLPAVVYGVDGVSEFPAQYLTGSTVADESGLPYELRSGEFRFPIVPAGQYEIRVEPPQGLSFASSLAPEDFDGLDNAPFTVEDTASYGLTFTQEIAGPLHFDIPLDADTELLVGKTANVEYGDVGDFITYTVNVENSGLAGAPVILRDTLPDGFRYVSGSTRVGGQSFAEPQIAADGEELIFDLGTLSSALAVNLTYVLEIGAGVEPGDDAVNAVVAIDRNGNSISNIARKEIAIREDLFRTRSTLVGRISEQSCDGEEDWAREITKGIGVEGVRLYMETGAYAVTDEDGLYHFEGVTGGTHVVQLDEETLPQGYEPMVCEESTRYADNPTSKFIEIQGGGLWRANFYLKRTGEVVEEKKVEAFNDLVEYKRYNGEWLATQTDEVDWVYPSPDRTPSIPSTNIGIKHAPNQRVELTLNGRDIPSFNKAGRDTDAQRTVMISRWRGVDLLEGRNDFVAKVLDADGTTIRTIKQDIHFVKNISRASAVPDQSILVADGRTNPELAIRLEDEAGRPVHAGRVAQIDIEAPYRLFNQAQIEGEAELVTPNSARTNVSVGADGIARIKLEPTLKTGKVTVVVTLDNGRKVELFMYLQPEKRDWILVGLAEGSIAYNALTNKARTLAGGALQDLEGDGRVAFFAKGMVKGDWLMTLAVDTDKRRGDRDGDFNTEIDPNAYYTLYGDRSYNEFEAVSRYPVYLKLEKKSFYAMFGDFNTDITEGKLTRYSRHLSGFKGEYLGEAFQAAAFAAETNQGFAKDEIAANGTSGPYRLSNNRVLANSETITIETRDRVRADLILESRRLIRHLDYTIDNFTGEIIFKSPVDVTDSGFNPNVIVVDYETANDSERNVTYGGRVQKQILDKKIQIGSTFVHEGGNSAVAGGEAEMIGIDAVAKVGKGTEVRAEYARARNSDDELGSESVTSEAYLAEIIHTSEKLRADAYVRQEEGGFGLGQRGSATNDRRRYGANVAYKIDEIENEDGGERGERNVTASLYKEDNLTTGDSRRLSEVTFNHDTKNFGASAGLRQVKDDLETGSDRDSVLALISARFHVPKHGATFEVSHEQPLGSEDTVSDFPERTRLSVEKSITSKARVRVSHDILGGENNGGQNTVLGVSYKPWNGTELTGGTDVVTSDSGRRIGATVGVDQQIQINNKWTASAGVSNRQIIGSDGPIEQVAPDAAVSSFERNESFTAAYVGVGYRNKNTSASARIEARETSATDTYTAVLGAAREVSEELSFAGALRATHADETANIAENDIIATNRNTDRLDGRLGLAWRPKDEDIIVLNRFDIGYNDQVNGDKTFKVVNNLAVNAQVTDRWQLSANHGVKYVESSAGGDTYSGTTHLLGAETRYDITEKVDLGLHGSVVHSPGADTTSYAFGPSIGVSPVENVWVSLGYNVTGYSDRDFQAAEYSRKGVYVKMRVKFDQNAAKEILDIISPSN